MSRFKAIGNFVYENGERIEDAESVARKLNAYQMRVHRLKVEVERLNLLIAEMDKTINISQAGCRELKAEVERLTKAGDDMAFHYQELVRIEWGSMTTHIPPSVVRWLAAKEGKPSV
jgi:predicted RNase H-like nuclease (RuvC/YqgF family)